MCQRCSPRGFAVGQWQLWDVECDTRHGQPLWRAARVCRVFHTDASAKRTGAVLNSFGQLEELIRVGDVQRRTVTSLFAEGERAQSSTAREALGPAVAVDSFAAQPAGTETTAYIDNELLGFARDKGSMKPDMNAPPCRVLEACRTHDIRPRVVWVPRELNSSGRAVESGRELREATPSRIRSHCANDRRKTLRTDGRRIRRLHERTTATFSQLAAVLRGGKHRCISAGLVRRSEMVFCAANNHGKGRPAHARVQSAGRCAGAALAATSVMGSALGRTKG